MTYLNTALGLASYFGFVSLFFFLLITKAKTKSPMLILEFFFINLFMLSLSAASQQGYATSAAGQWGDLERWLLSYATFVFFILCTFAKVAPAGKLFSSAPIFFKLASFLFFFIVSVAATSMLDAVITLEFMNIAMLLYFLQSVGTSGALNRLGKTHLSSSYDASSSKYTLQAAATLFFTMFFIAIFFFTFVSLTLFLTFGESSYAALGYFRTMLSQEPYFFLFFVLLLLKVGGAPLHLWKLEAFSSLGIGYILYYSVVYLFFFFSIAYSLFVKLGFYFSPEFMALGSLILVLNLVFVMANTYAVVEIRHFVVLSTLLNSSFFILSIFLVLETSLNFYALFFFNYLVTSLLLFAFLTSTAGSLKFVSRVRGLANRYTNVALFLVPVISLSGAAPLLGFSVKLLLLVSCAGGQQSLIFSLLILSILFTLTFYFQLFKNFFFSSNQAPSPAVPSAATYTLVAVSVLVLLAPAALSFVIFSSGASLSAGSL